MTYSFIHSLSLFSLKNMNFSKLMIKKGLVLLKQQIETSEI